MKKIFLLACALSFGSVAAKAQVIFGSSLHQNLAKNSYSVLSNQDDKDLIEDLKNFAKN